MKNLPIQGNDFVIDKISVDDARPFMEFMEKPEIQRFIPDRFESEDELRECLEWLISNYDLPSGEIVRLTFLVRGKGAGEMLGWVSYGPLPSDEKLKEIAYAIDPAHWGKGHASGAVRLFLDWLGRNLGVAELYAEVDPQNIASIKVLEHNGFEPAEAFAGPQAVQKRIYIRKGEPLTQSTKG